MKRIIFESPAEFSILCVLLGLGYAAIQYYRVKKQPWGRPINLLLFASRAALTAFLAFLLLGPIVKQINNLYEKPHFVFLYDNSASVKQTVDSATLGKLTREVDDLQNALAENGYSTSTQDLKGDAAERINFNLGSSDIHSALRRISHRYEGQKIAGVVLVSDGIYNTGLSPLYGNYNYPVYTVGVGDTTERTDVSIRNMAYNKIAYQGNKFPLRVEVQTKNLRPQEISISLLRRGKVIDRQTQQSKGDNDLIAFDFQPLAEEQGIQKFDVVVEAKPGEQNSRNNRASLFVEVVEGKKKILVVAPAPHPDIKALREVVEKNSNYEFHLHIPGISENPPGVLRPENIDLAIFHQSPDTRGRTTGLFQSFLKSKSSLFLILGQQSDVTQLARQDLPLKFEGAPRDFDEVTPVVNQAFSNFTISQDAHVIMADFPPVYVHFGKAHVHPTSTILLYQKVGSVTTDKPLLVLDIKDSKKTAIMSGEGLWRWKLNEFDKTEQTASFDELFGKLIQFLTTTDDKRKFRSYPIKQEFSDTEPVVFESQVYNDIYEPIYGNSIEINITDETGKKNLYSYVTSPGNIRYQIGGLKEGVYGYRARTNINGAVEEVRGEFAVTEQQAELQNLTADFDLLRKVSAATGGNFHPASNMAGLKEKLQRVEAKSVIHTEESYDSVINLKWVFWILLLLVSAEWFLRKFYGSY